ncbi:DNA polymerase [Tautonia plasticadhaerens]|uniref:DNA polymerase I n=1 Tax=Tautonia plasticadhaerens TaxID=2527974 RepID=A0A518H9C2_9BACT|nr:DNA polymerase [Tautonia plasticadhaerens]QDV37433.1 DNA polymerase I, thermostable [Tautonia plasticadhaerens]
MIAPHRLAHVTIGERTFPCERPWDARPLELRPRCPYIAFDTETTVVDLRREVPQLVLASFCSGRRQGLLHPDQIGPFILAHREARLIAHNAAFDFWVVDRHLRERAEEEALRSWWNLCDRGRLHCSMTLDMLIRLAEGRPGKGGGDRIEPRNLAEVAAEVTSLRITKEDTARTSFGEILGANWEGIDQRFLDYAVRDAIVTYPTYLSLSATAERLMRGHGYAPDDPGDERSSIRPDAVRSFGLLSEAVQVKGAIALAAITRNGIDLDAGRVARLEAEYRGQLDTLHEQLARDYPGLFHADREGRPRIGGKMGLPSVNQKGLREHLIRAARQAESARGRAIEIPLTDRGKQVSTAAAAWAEHAEDHPLFATWAHREQLRKMLEFFGRLGAGRVHPRYDVLKRTGRTSCSDPNVQNLPRKGGVRELFLAGPGRLLLMSDYAAVELRTLAATCLARYGSSRLAETIRAGIDPHCYTAAMLLGLPLERFMALADADDEVELDGRRQVVRGHHFRRHRQDAKAVNFGVPGGLGARGLVDYARASYGVELTVEQAEAFRSRLIREVYPELERYLADETMAALARNLGTREEECWEALDRGGRREPSLLRGVENLVKGRTQKRDGTPYNERWVSDVWETLADLDRGGDPGLSRLLADRQAGPRLHRRLFGRPAVTLTGRIRGGCSYTEACNAPFQGLAADGAKWGLWGLLKAGYRTVAFIHDEVLVTLPDEGGHVAEAEIRRVESVLRDAMASVLVGDISIACESSLADRWTKEAGMVVVDGKARPLPAPAVAGEAPQTSAEPSAA